MNEVLTQVADMIYSLSKTGGNRKLGGVSYEDGVSSKVLSEVRSFNFEGDFIVIEQNVFDGLKGSEIRLLIEITKSLKLNNPLWYCDPKRKEKSHFRTTIATLIKKSIITNIIGSDIYIVNPKMLRKGNALTGLFAIYERFQRRLSKNKNWIPTQKDIVVMKVPQAILNFEVVAKRWEEGL